MEIYNNAKIPAFLFNSVYNQKKELPDYLKRVGTWNELYEIVDSYKK